MTLGLLVQAAQHSLVRGARHWIFHLGALGFIPLGLLDASIVPVPGSMDVLLIALASRREDLWIYYAAMATAGSVIGELVTYRFARRGGKEMVERRLSKQAAKKVYARFERWGFGAIAVPALLPPPVPLLPFVLAAGALQYSQSKFTLAVASGRAVRFAILGFLAARYGRGIFKELSRHDHWVVALVIVVTLAALGYAIFLFSRRRQRRARA